MSGSLLIRGILGPMKKGHGKSILELRLPVAATPGRVEAAAQMFRLAIEAAYDDLPPDSVTMVVDNFKMNAGIRAWDRAGRTAVTRVEKVVRDPIKEIRARPASQRIADAIAKCRSEIQPYSPQILSPGTKKKPVPMDETFFNAIEGVAKRALPETDRLRGGTEVYSLVYRVGRVDESKEIAARITVEGRTRDVPIQTEALARRLFDAARDGRMVRLILEAHWLRDGMAWTVDPRSVRIIAMNEMEPISGADFLSQVPIFPSTDDEVRSLLEELKGDE